MRSSVRRSPSSRVNSIEALDIVEGRRSDIGREDLRYTAESGANRLRQNRLTAPSARHLHESSLGIGRGGRRESILGRDRVGLGRDRLESRERFYGRPEYSPRGYSPRNGVAERVASRGYRGYAESRLLGRGQPVLERGRPSFGRGRPAFERGVDPRRSSLVERRRPSLADERRLAALEARIQDRRASYRY